MARLYRLLIVLFASTVATAAQGATYSLPAALGSGIFSNCSAVTYNCTGNISIGSNDTVNFTASMTLNVSGNFTVDNNSTINGSGYTVNIVVGGDIQFGNSMVSAVNFTAGGNFQAGNTASITGNITASGDVQIGNSGTVTGNISAGGNLSLGSGTTVVGSCSPTNAQCTSACTSSTSGATTTVTCTANGTFTPPTGVTAAVVEAWAGGGGGGAATGNPAKGGGGAGGQYAMKAVAVTAGTNYAVVVGAGGSGGSSGAGSAGGDSTFNGTTVVAKGGAGGGGATTNGGDGTAGSGSTTGGVGDTVYAGGSGAAGNATTQCNSSGGGGGGAGSGGSGGSASAGSNTGGTGTATGGGNGGTASNSSAAGGNGSTYGGGGSGACAESDTDRSGGAGGAGKVVITYPMVCEGFESGIGGWTIDNTGGSDPDYGTAVSDTTYAQGGSKSMKMSRDWVQAAMNSAIDTTNASGSISFGYARGLGGDYPETTDDLQVEYLNSSGTWTTLTTLNGTTASDTGFLGYSATLPANAKHSGFKMRFTLISGSGNATNDYDQWYLDNVCVPGTAATATVNHYELSLPSGSVACATSAVTVTACADSTSPCTNKVTTISGSTAGLSTSAGSLASTTVTFDATGTASTTLSYAAASNGATATVTLSGESSAATNSRQCCPNGTGCSVANSCSTTFNTAGFIFTTAADGTTQTIAAQTAGTEAAVHYLRAVKTSTTTKACEAALSGSNAVTLGYACSNPASCTSGNYMNITPYNGAAAQATVALPSTGSSVTMYFDANGNAPLAFNYLDVGSIALTASKAAGGSLLTDLSGSSNAFVVKPAGFSLVATCVDGTVNAANQTTPSTGDPKFCRAGKTFSVVATTLNALNNATPNYGKETAPETVAVAWSRQLPAAGANGTLPSGSPSYTGSGGVFGTATNYAWSWDEVGILKATPAIGDGDYLGAGNVTGTAYVGRFYPDHFKVDITPQCGGFVYGGHAGTPVATGQPFSVKATAMNGKTTPTATTNYTYGGGFALPVNLTLSAGGTAGKLYVDATQGGTGAIPAAKFVSNGEGEVLYSAASGKISYVFDNATTAPTTVTIHGDDADTATSTGTDGSTQAYTGRLRLANAFGSEHLALTMPALLEYYDGSSWKTNALDSCTSFATLVGPTAALTVGTGTTTPRCNVAGTTCTTISGAACNASTAAVSSGSVGLCLTAPGDVGQADVTFAPATYLQHSSGVLTGRAGFGLYNQSGNSKRIIFRREMR